MTLTLKIGKRYVRRDGKVTGPLIASPYVGTSHPFMDPNERVTYTASGCWMHDAHDEDLVREYKSTKPEWRVVIKCESRDVARMVKKELIGFVNMDKITVEKSP